VDHASGLGLADWPDEPFSCSFAEDDSAAVAPADAVLVAVDPAGARLSRLLAPRLARGPFQDLRWLLAPFRLAIRFERCRGAAGDVVLFGDGNLDAPVSEAPTAFLEAAFHFARKHARRSVTVALAGPEGAGEARPALDAVRRAAAGLADVCGVAWDEAGVEEVLARAVRGALGELDVVAAPGEAWGRIEPVLADAAGGAPLVPSARFGEECALLEVGCAGSRVAAGAGAERACPIAAIRAAALLCEWLGETGKGARIAAAADDVVRDRLPAPPASSALDEAAAHWAMDIADAVVRRF
jgi:hypothetical protein